MTKVDQFESVFKSAAKAVYEHGPIKLDRVLVVSDEAEAGARTFEKLLQGFLERVSGVDKATWSLLTGDSFRGTESLLRKIEAEAPDLIITYRNLHSSDWKFSHSLGSHLDVLTQRTEPPVLVVPHPTAKKALDHAIKNTDRVMAITNHLTGDGSLVRHAVAFTEPGGTLFLTHVEDDRVFARYIDVISKIPSIDTDSAKATLRAQLLKEPRDYIDSCREALEAAGVDCTVEAEIIMGRRLSEYRRLVTEHEVDLLVMHTKDKDQLAMHGMAYPLAVELREIPLLLI